MANNDLFSSLISDIKTYTGKDPLLPWLRGIRKMKESLPSHILNEKLPRFLQKCTKTFESDRRYRDDLRYIRVWLQLMDYLEDPRSLLRSMEEKRIGCSRSLFYQAYALYYEKIKKFDEAEKMYHLGVQRLAEPVDELHKSYEQFLHRMRRHNNKIQKNNGRTSKKALSVISDPPNCDETKENTLRTGVRAKGLLDERSLLGIRPDEKIVETKVLGERSRDLKPLATSHGKFCSDDTVRNFVDTALVGKSEAEDARHCGLVEPTINMKEVMNAISSMFSEPLEMDPIARRSHKSHPNKDDIMCSGFEVYVDENSSNESKPTSGEPLKIFVDDEASDESGNLDAEKDYFEQIDVQNEEEGSNLIDSRANVFVFPSPKDLPSENFDNMEMDPTQAKFREDTVVCRFVGSAISDEPVVENVCHHGLVEPTVNLKEAMEEINNMFGKPIDFTRTKRSKKMEKPPEQKTEFSMFVILPDDDLEPPRTKLAVKSSGKSRECDLYEPTMFTKEAMDEINKMFGMPMDL